MNTFATTAPISALVDVPAARIQLIAADRADTTVEILPANPGKSRDVRIAEQITVDYADGVLRIQAPAPEHRVLGHTGAVEVTVQLPAGSHVEAKAAGSELRVVGRLGDLTFDGAYRRIKIDEASALRLIAHDGDVEVGRLTGSADIKTARGAIRIAEAGRGNLVLDTGMGDITVGAAAGVSASLDAGTGNGRVSNALKNDGTTVLAIHATTGQGDITARSL